MDNTKNTFGVIILGIIILLFVFGGYFLMDYMVKNDNTGNSKGNNNEEQKEDLRIDTSRDFIYYDNSEEFLESEEIVKEDVVLNFKSLNNLNDTLHQELEEIFDTVVKIEDVNIPSGTTIREGSNGYYSFSYREYVDAIFGNYVSLVVLDFDYDCINGSKIKKIKSYVVDKKTGNLITNDELLNSFNVTEDMILESVRERLNNTQVLDGDSQVIDIEGSISSIKNNDYESGVKSLSVSKNGKLTINFIVKTNKINYNDSIEIN